MCQDPDGDLYQWFRGSKLCAGDIEALVTLEQDGQAIDVKVRGTHALRLACFYFMEEILAVIDQVPTVSFKGMKGTPRISEQQIATTTKLDAQIKDMENCNRSS